MNRQSGQSPNEIWELLEALCEDRLTSADAERLEKIVRNDAKARWIYLAYMDLHGTLYWDTAAVAAPEQDGFTPPGRPASKPDDGEWKADNGVHVALDRELLAAVFSGGSRKAAPACNRRRSRWNRIGTVCALLLLGFVLAWTFTGNSPDNDMAERRQPHETIPTETLDRPPIENRTERPFSEMAMRDRLRLPSQDSRTSAASSDTVPSDPETPELMATPTDPEQIAEASSKPDSEGNPNGPMSADAPPGPVAFINQRLREEWKAAEIEPSPTAGDAEWLRRVYLDIVGHIPPAEVAQAFLQDRDPQKRSRLIDRLLDDTDYVRHMATIWTNLMIGRSEARGVSRRALRKFLRESFAQNRGWDQIVFDLVAAEGHPEENGATNFLLAHLNNQAVPATAITVRLFMGVDVQCVQCHNHPFNDWEQKRFWAYNSFFQQTEKIAERTFNPRTGQDMPSVALISKSIGGPTFYENPRLEMRAAFPEFEGQRISAAPEVNRRRELARLMVEGERPLVADAMVNRMWAHLFGYGFTRPVDDMGPHNSPTHPELLDRLSREFVKSGYDLKQLIRWICNSEVYHLSSRFHEGNLADDPDAGHPPLFSRMYVKLMTAEQLYDSLIVATGAHRSGHSRWEEAERKRQQWLQQFIMVFQTEENDEVVNFDGTITQALMMMNSDLIESAISTTSGTYFNRIATERTDEVEKIKKLWLSALSRYPTERELRAMRRLLRHKPATTSGKSEAREALISGLQDVFWALLNSNEFIMVH